MKIYILKALFDIPYEYSWYVVILASADEEKVKALKEKLTIEYNEQIKIRQEINKELKKLPFPKFITGYLSENGVKTFER